MNLLELHYVRISKAVKWRWEDNPNEHDIGNLIVSIETYGFRDPIEYDEVAEIITSGHGRLKACEQLYLNRVGTKVPNGLHVFEDGEWGVPVIFGAKSKDKNMAYQYAIDANNLVMTGGQLTPIHVAKGWGDGLKYLEVIQKIGGSVTADNDHIQAVKNYYDKLNEPDEEELEEEEESYVEDDLKKVFFTFDEEQYEIYVEYMTELKELTKRSNLTDILLDAMGNYRNHLI